MKIGYVTFCMFVVLGFIFCWFMGSGFNAPKAAENASIRIMKKETVGDYLADGNGMALYTYTKDEQNISNCLEGCARNWPPFFIDSSAVIEGCDLNDFTAITRPDGLKQTAYKGRPLYYFKNDKYPGDTFGQGLGDVWFLATP